MKYRQWRRLHSQNYLRDPKLVDKLIRLSSIGKYDTVIEIGPGFGIITKELVKAAGKVVAVEIDQNLFFKLQKIFRFTNNLQLINCDFLKFSLPNYQYKVFANIPFRFTADILRKLTVDSNFLEGYLVVQKEAAKKFIGKPFGYKNSMMAVLFKPWFKFTVFWKFNRLDFSPVPNIDCLMMKIERRKTPLISVNRKESYKDFVIYSFNRKKVASWDFSKILEYFDNYEKYAGPWEREIVGQQANKITNNQKRIEKIHRTRLDKSWRNYRFVK